MDLPLYACQVLAYAGLFVLASNGGQLVSIICRILFVAGFEGECEWVEGLGLF